MLADSGQNGKSGYTASKMSIVSYSWWLLVVMISASWKMGPVYVPLSLPSERLANIVSQNHMQESILIFKSILNSRWFRKSALILFLNKMDLFKSKLEHSPIQRYFPD